MEQVLSYTSGPSERELIGETIGANLARTLIGYLRAPSALMSGYLGQRKTTSLGDGRLSTPERQS